MEPSIPPQTLRISRRDTNTAGGAWVTFSFANVAELRASHERLRSGQSESNVGTIEPYVALLSPPSVSLFYCDMDGNMMELSAQRPGFTEAGQVDEWLMTGGAKRWPPGVPFDPNAASSWEQAGAHAEGSSERPDSRL
jgi:hypothetical protein